MIFENKKKNEKKIGIKIYVKKQKANNDRTINL